MEIESQCIYDQKGIAEGGENLETGTHQHHCLKKEILQKALMFSSTILKGWKVEFTLYGKL